MPLNTEPVIHALRTISEEKELQICVTESLKGGLVAGVSTVIGGLLAGPVGLAIGSFKKNCILYS